jgi:hypothetical protein
MIFNSLLSIEQHQATRSDQKSGENVAKKMPNGWTEALTSPLREISSLYVPFATRAAKPFFAARSADSSKG